MPNKCECADSHCPGHRGYAVCPHDATATLYRVDMEDRTGTLFCSECLDDAMMSGLFTDAR